MFYLCYSLQGKVGHCLSCVLEMALPYVLALLPLLCSASALSLPNMTATDAAVAGGGISPILVAGNPSNLGSGNLSLSGGGGLAGSNPGGQSVPDSGGGSGISSGGSPAGGSGSASGGGSNSGLGGSGNNSAMIQGQKNNQYEKCAGPGDPGPCKQYIYKWRYEPTTNECTNFIWGGCEGNPQNRFGTEAECLFHCIGGPRKH